MLYEALCWQDFWRLTTHSPECLQIVKDIKKKESPRSCHSQEKPVFKIWLCLSSSQLCPQSHSRVFSVDSGKKYIILIPRSHSIHWGRLHPSRWQNRWCLSDTWTLHSLKSTSSNLTFHTTLVCVWWGGVISLNILTKFWVGGGPSCYCNGPTKTHLLRRLFSKAFTDLISSISHPYLILSFMFIYIFSAHYSLIVIIIDCACIYYSH